MLPCLEDRELDRAETRFKSDPFLFSMLSVDFRIGMLPHSIAAISFEMIIYTFETSTIITRKNIKESIMHSENPMVALGYY